MKFERSNWYAIGLAPLVKVSGVTFGSGKNLPLLSSAFVISVSVSPPAGIVPVKKTEPLPLQFAVIAVTAKCSSPPALPWLFCALAIVVASDQTSAMPISAARTGATVFMGNRSRILKTFLRSFARGRSAPPRPNRVLPGAENGLDEQHVLSSPMKRSLCGFGAEGSAV